MRQGTGNTDDSITGAHTHTDDCKGCTGTHGTHGVHEGMHSTACDTNQLPPAGHSLCTGVEFACVRMWRDPSRNTVQAKGHEVGVVQKRTGCK
jgi:hypothetical protein